MSRLKIILHNKSLSIIVFLVVAFLLRLINLNQSFWLDEAAQVIESSRPLSQQLDIVADFHPPLFHLILHFWMYLGNSEIWVRLLSVFLSLGSIFLIYKIGVVVGNRLIAVIAAFFLVFSPYHIWYSQEARPYMLFVFTSLASTYFLLRKRWVLYSVTAVLSLYSLYFTPFLLLGHLGFIILFERKYLFSFFKSTLVALLLFSLWLPMFFKQLVLGTSGNFKGWTKVVSLPTLKAVVLTFAKFIFGRGSIDNNFIYTLVIFPVFLIFLLCSLRLMRRKNGRELLVLFYVPLTAAVVISLFIPVLAPQRLIFLLPFFYLIIAAGISLQGKNIRLLSIIIVFIISVSGIYQYYLNPYVKREKWREAVKFVEGAGVKSLAIFIFPDPFAPYKWYQTGKIDTLALAPKFRIRESDLEEKKNQIQDYNRIYLFQYLTGLTDPKEKARKYLKNTGYKEIAIKDFPGVGFIYIFDNRDKIPENESSN